MLNRPHPVRHRRLTGLRTAVFVGASLCGSALSVSAATFYVAPAGNDSNAGTQTAPFRTIQRAANIVNPGDTVIVEDGTYTGVGTGTPCASSSSRPVVCVARGGTSTAWVTFRARNAYGAKVSGQNNTSTHGFRFSAGAAYVRVEGFDISGIGNATGGAAGILVYSGGHHVVLAHNAIHDIGRMCTDHIYGMSGIYVQNTAVTIDGNLIHSIGRYAPGEQGCSPSTNNYQNHDHGIYINGKSDGSAPGASQVAVINNRFFDNARGWGIQVYPDPVAGLRIQHNTFATANPYRTGQIILAANTSDGRITNNVFQDPTTAGINFSSGAHTNLQVANNLSSAALSTTRPSGVTFTNNREQTDARLDPETFAVLADSPAVDGGLTIAAVPVDIAGRSRPNGASSDIGADEQGGSTATPAPPPAPTTDTVAPTVRITSPTSGASVRRSVSIAATAADNVGVVKVSFFVDGKQLTADTTAPFTASWNARRAAAGTHTIAAVAYDAAGLTATAVITVRR